MSDAARTTWSRSSSTRSCRAARARAPSRPSTATRTTWTRTRSSATRPAARTPRATRSASAVAAVRLRPRPRRARPRAAPGARLASRGRHLVEVGLEVHRLRTEHGLAHRRATATRAPPTARASRAARGCPSDLDSPSTRRASAPGCRTAGTRDALSLEAGLRLDWSGVNRRATLSPRARRDRSGSGATTRLRAGGGLFTQSPGYEKLIQSDYFVDLVGRSRPLAALRARGPRRRSASSATSRRGLSVRVEGYWKRLRRPRRRPARDRGGEARRASRTTTSRPSSRRASRTDPDHHELPRERGERALLGLRRARASGPRPARG